MGFNPPRDVSQRSHNFLFSQGNFHPDKQFSEIVRARFEKSSFLNEMISLNSHNWRVIKKTKPVLLSGLFLLLVQDGGYSVMKTFIFIKFIYKVNSSCISKLWIFTLFLLDGVECITILRQIWIKIEVVDLWL